MHGHLRLLAALAAIPAAMLPASADAAAPCANASVIPSQENLDRVRDATLCLVNRQRSARRLRPLRANRELATAAHRYVNTMTTRRFFAHVSPDGSTPASRIKVTLYLADAKRWSIAENLAWGGGKLATPRRMVAAWMRSAPHRRNMLSPRFRELGVGIAVGTPHRGQRAGATYATEFGVRVTTR